MFKSTLRSMLFVVPTVAVLCLTSSSAVSACDPPRCYYKDITVWVPRQVAETIWVTVYDDYGCAHRVPKTIYNTIKVPVTRTVKVCY